MKNQRNQQCLALLLCAASLAACGSKQGETDEQASQPFVEYTAAQGDDIHRHAEVNMNGSVRVGGHTYDYSINGVPCDSLPVVTDDEGTRYADNLFQLIIKRDGEAFVNRTITKASLSHKLTSEFRQNGILDGIIYDDRQSGLRFRVSVSFPESDVHTPLLIQVGSDGSLVYERDIQAEQDE